MFKLLKFQENNLLVYSIIFLIILLGFVFRFYNINYENLWLDEIYSFWVTDPNLSFTETYLRVQTTESIPFLYYYLVKICNKIFGYDPIIGRCFSAFFGFLPAARAAAPVLESASFPRAWGSPMDPFWGPEAQTAPPAVLGARPQGSQTGPTTLVTTLR